MPGMSGNPRIPGSASIGVRGEPRDSRVRSSRAWVPPQYNHAMPRPPLIASDSRRAAVISALMLIILATTLGIAFAFTQRRNGQSHVATEPAQFGGLTIQVPAKWPRD